MTPRQPIGVWQGRGLSQGALPPFYWSPGSHILPPAARLRTFYSNPDYTVVKRGYRQVSHTHTLDFL
jgi:hypothetical protein